MTDPVVPALADNATESSGEMSFPDPLALSH